MDVLGFNESNEGENDGSIEGGCQAFRGVRWRVYRNRDVDECQGSGSDRNRGCTRIVVAAQYQCGVEQIEPELHREQGMAEVNHGVDD